GFVAGWRIIDEDELEQRVVKLTQRIKATREIIRAISRADRDSDRWERTAIKWMGNMKEIIDTPPIWLRRQCQCITYEMLDDGFTLLFQDRFGQSTRQAVIFR